MLFFGVSGFVWAFFMMKIVQSTTICFLSSVLCLCLLLEKSLSFQTFHLSKTITQGFTSSTSSWLLPSKVNDNNDGLFVGLPLTNDFNYSTSNTKYLKDLNLDTQKNNVLNLVEQEEMEEEEINSSSERIEEDIVELISQLTILGLGTVGTANILGQLFVSSEWFQEWRYLWPLIGGLYIVDGLQPFLDEIKTTTDDDTTDKKNSLLPFPISSNNNKGLSLISILGGIGLLIGGAYDAFMPVWQTGPVSNTLYS